jgi:hypothetical protein
MPSRRWPLSAVETPAPVPVVLTDALDGFFANSTGTCGILIATSDRVLCDRCCGVTIIELPCAPTAARDEVGCPVEDVMRDCVFRKM